jgi:hypothetical protein
MNYPQPEILTNSIKIETPPSYMSVPQYKFEMENTSRRRINSSVSVNEDGVPSISIISDERHFLPDRLYNNLEDAWIDNDSELEFSGESNSILSQKSREYRAQRRLEKLQSREERREARRQAKENRFRALGMLRALSNQNPTDSYTV